VQRILGTLLSASNLVRVIAYRVRSDSGAPVPMKQWVRVPESDRRALLTDIRALCREAGVRLAVIIPWYRSFDQHVHVLRELEGQSDVVVIDLPGLLAALPKPRSSYFVDDVHPNAEGHQLIAAAIERKPREEWR